MSKAIHLSDPDRDQSAIAAITAWARECGAAIARPDSAHRQVVSHTTEGHRPFWLKQNPQRIFGLVSFVIAGALEAHGILAWRSDPCDGHLRVVHTEWLTAHADIFRHVFGDSSVGYRCRFCRTAEIATSNQLQPVEYRRNPVSIDSVARLPRGAVLTHSKCRPHWERWHAIAAQYKTLEEAQAADNAAGRESRALPAMPGPEPVEASALSASRPSRHRNPAEQGA